MFDVETKIEIAKIAKRLQIPAAALLAVAEVESGGRTLAKVQGKLEPLIRFEGHYFNRFLKGEAKLEARSEGLASGRAGGVKNPRSQVGRWKLLNRAIRINRTAALSSVSWGLGQVMGAHWQWLGYGSVDALVAEARSGIVGQVALMARYIEKAGLVKALHERDWVAFARRYNGPSFHKNKYDQKIGEAFVRITKEAGKAVLPIPINEDFGDQINLKFGARGQSVKLLQRALTLKGYVLVADGLFGLITDRVVRQYQRDHLLEETGIVEKSLRTSIFGKASVVVGCVRETKSKIVKATNMATKVAHTKISGVGRKWKRKLRKGLLSISKRIA
ncbi:MAG: N-acetylmuramidase domain-containing protein [Rhizobiaceae bacterium]